MDDSDSAVVEPFITPPPLERGDRVAIGGRVDLSISPYGIDLTDYRVDLTGYRSLPRVRPA